MWFKNLFLFTFEKPFTLTPEALHKALSTKPFSPCSANQRESLGWSSPFGRKHESLVHAANQFILLSMSRQERLLPAAVIKETLEEQVADIEVREDRRVSAKEKKELRENIEHELLPKAFTRTSKIDAWIDPRGGWLVINTPSTPRAEDFTKLLRKTLGSLPVSLVDTEIVPATAMTQWLGNNTVPAPFTLGYECELKSLSEDKSVATYRQQDLQAEEVQNSLHSGKYAAKLALEWDDKISFVLTEELQIKKLKFLDVLEEQLQDNDPQTHEEHIDIEFTLMTGEVSRMLNDLFKRLS